MGATMSPEYVADQVVETLRSGAPATLFVPHLPLVMGNFWQNALPTPVFDFFLSFSNKQMANWNPAQANKIFEKMQAKP